MPGKIFYQTKLSMGSPGTTSSPKSSPPEVGSGARKQTGPAQRAQAAPTQNCALQARNEERRQLVLGVGWESGAGGGVLFMKNEIITFRSVVRGGSHWAETNLGAGAG